MGTRLAGAFRGCALGFLAGRLWFLGRPWGSSRGRVAATTRSA